MSNLVTNSKITTIVESGVIINKKFIITPCRCSFPLDLNHNGLILANSNNSSILEVRYNDINNSFNIKDFNFSLIEQKLSLSYNHISSYLSNVFSYLGKGGYHLPIPEMNLPPIMSLPLDRFPTIVEENLSSFSYNLPAFYTHNIGGISDYFISIFNSCDPRLSILFIVIISFSFMTKFIGLMFTFIGFIFEFIYKGIKSLYIITCSGYKRADQIFSILRDYKGTNGR